MSTTEQPASNAESLEVASSRVHPELAGRARFLPRSVGRTFLRVARILGRLIPHPRMPAGVHSSVVHVPGRDAGTAVRIRTYRPEGLRQPAPALLWIHGGGYVLGRPEQDARTCIHFARELGIVVVAVAYRHAPEHPFPAALDDCHAALRFLRVNAAEWGIDASRIAIGGASAGGGLTAGLAQRVRDVDPVQPVFQLLVYPMIDDRTTMRPVVPHARPPLWTDVENLFGWSSYLGRTPSHDEPPPHAVPARRGDLAGLPPAWVGVGTIDLFHEENVAYASRLVEHGVPCELVVVPGAYHGFDVVSPGADVTRSFVRSQVDALRSALFPNDSGEIARAEHSSARG